MFYVDLLGWLDILSKYYPRFHSNELLLLADDAVKWMSDELPEDSSAVLHLRKYFTSPAEAVRMLWREVYSVAMPYMNVN